MIDQQRIKGLTVPTLGALLLVVSPSSAKVGDRWLCVPKSAVGYEFLKDDANSAEFVPETSWIFEEIEGKETDRAGSRFRWRSSGEDTTVYYCEDPLESGPGQKPLWLNCGNVHRAFSVSLETMKYISHSYGSYIFANGTDKVDASKAYIEIGGCKKL